MREKNLQKRVALVCSAEPFIFFSSYILLYVLGVCSDSIVARAMQCPLSEDLCYLQHCEEDPPGGKGIER